MHEAGRRVHRLRSSVHRLLWLVHGMPQFVHDLLQSIWVLARGWDCGVLGRGGKIDSILTFLKFELFRADLVDV